jgi:4-amino-4-deoxy-L-arabinose transferase-like glycosyltransferase
MTDLSTGALSKWFPRPSAHRVALGLIVALGIVVRFAGIAFGLPNTGCRPDEATILDAAWNVFSGDPNPHFFYYPSLYIYLLAGLIFARYVVLRLMGVPETGLLTEMTTDPSSFFIMSRSVSALFGAAMPIVVYLIVRKFRDKTTALLAALFMSLCYLHVRDSHFGATDVTAAFFILCSVLFVMDAFEKGRLRDYVRAGVLAGMATATKYGSLMVIGPMLFAHACVHARSGAPPAARLLAAVRDRRLWLYAACALLGFLVFTPFALFDFRTFASHFSSEMNHLMAGHSIMGQPIQLGRGWWYHAWRTLPIGMGPLMFLAGLIGIVAAFRKAPLTAAVVFLFPLVYYVTAGRGYTVFLRYMIPVLPFLCMGAAILTMSLVGPLTGSRLQYTALALIIAALLLQPTRNVIRMDRLLATRDNRLVAGDWIKAHLPAGKTIYQTGLPYGHIEIPPGLVQFSPRHSSTGALPDYILVQQHPLPASMTTAAIVNILKANYHILRYFQAVNAQSKRNVYDPLDAFYLPFAGFDQIARPGPNLIVFERNAEAKP